MRTDELIELLVADLRPVQRFAVLRRFGIASLTVVRGASNTTCPSSAPTMRVKCARQIDLMQTAY